MKDGARQPSPIDIEKSVVYRKVYLPSSRPVDSNKKYEEKGLIVYTSKS
jgi:hypothetical protein